MDSIEKAFSGVEGEDDGKNGDGQDDEEHAEEQPENEEFPCTIGVDAKGYAETEDGEQQGEWGQEKTIAEKVGETVKRYCH